MIGKIIIGKSFRGCISYCLEDKKHQVQKVETTQHRAEVLSHNLCYGDKHELIRQFNDVRNLNPKLSKPVMHITLSLAPGESLSKEKLSGFIEDCAKELGFEKNQYIGIGHNDTLHQHLHIIVNRVGFDGKTVTDSNNYQKIAAFCRKMELKYQLQKVLSPRRFLSKAERQIPRVDSRKIKLRQDITDSLWNARSFHEFEQRMRQKNYIVQKGRGIAFIDSKKVRIKGSEVGFPLGRIQQILATKVSLKKEVSLSQQPGKLSPTYSPKPHIVIQPLQQKKMLHSPLLPIAKELFLNPPPSTQEIHPALLKKKRKKRRSQHL